MVFEVYRLFILAIGSGGGEGSACENQVMCAMFRLMQIQLF